MTIDELAIAPRITDPGPPPPDVPPSVGIEPVTDRVVAGIPTSINLFEFPGAHYVLDIRTSTWQPQPIVTFVESEVSTDGVDIRDHSGSSGPFRLTFATAGDHTVQASCRTSDGRVFAATPITVHVVAAVPPAFTVVAPADGAVVNLNEGGAQLDVHVTIPAGQPFPMTVTLSWDNQTTVDQTNATDFVKTISLAPKPLGARPIAVSVADRDGIGSTKTVSINGHDVAPPHLVVVDPVPSANLVGDADGHVTHTMTGTASDTQSGVAGGSAAVAWALSPTGQRTAAHPLSGNDFSSWAADVPLSGFGAHTIYVWATDQAGNTMSAPVSVPVTVISSFVPATLDERLGEREYLAALLSFAQEQVTLPGPPPAPLDTQTLVGVLGQPLDRLSQPLSAAADRGGQEINQLRVPVELLRARIAATHAATGPGASGERDYLNTAYAALLAALGTTYAELRLARGAPADRRQALAAGLGIRLSPTTPDELDRLVLDGDALTEAALENLFGLPQSTTTDPLRQPTTPLTLTWRLAGLTTAWAEQDQHPNPPRSYAVLADPDVIGGADVAPGPNSDPIRALLAQRAQQLADYATLLDGLRTKSPDAATALAAMQAQALPGADLVALETQDGQGVDITAALAALGLTRAGFLYLRQLSRLAATGTVTPAEWSDGIAVLTRAHKQTLYAAWRAQETAFVLSPDFFVLADAGPRVNPYRVDARTRGDWQNVLRARIAQRQNLIDASAQAVADTEQLALPILRDALLADLAPGTTGDLGEELSALFFVDMLAAGTLRTTRLRQGIESVQALLSAKRSGELTHDHPAFGWTINVDAFTPAWAWLGELGNWQSATMAFLFPERNLDPTLLVPGADPPQPLDNLFDAIRGSGPFTGAAASQQAVQYLHDAKFTPAFTYLDPHRSVKHQQDLHDISKQQSDQVAKEVFWVVPMLLAQRLQSAGDYQAALDWYWLVYPYDVDGQPVSIYDRLNLEKSFRPNLTFPPGWSTALDPFALVANRPTPYTRYTLLAIIRCHLDFANAEFSRETDESVANARALYLAALRLLDLPALQPQLPLNPGEPALPVPEFDALRSLAQVQLAKLRQGRNVAGMPRTQLNAAATTVTQPTPYRFKVLLDRARQLTAQAAQMEAGYLAALEKYDDRNLRLVDALKAIDLNAAQVSLSASRVKEANDAVTAAVAQRVKADTMSATYGALLAAGPNQYETDLLGEYGQMRGIKDDLALDDVAIGVAQAAESAGNVLDDVFSFGFKPAMAAAAAAGIALKGRSQIQLDSVEAQIQANQLQAGIEQRRSDWRVQQTSAQQDSLLAQAQVVTATDQVTIAVQEQAVASLQYDQAVATLKFLNGQFTNADLYLWMSNTLGGVYRYFLQQATATARLAQAQLSFERAEPAQTLIRNDYWQSPAELTSGAQTSRRGLTGAEQLGEDLTRLDEYAFSSERRRLNLSQTFSLARLMPVEFLQFRQTGVLPFATPMALFDNDFPGHYLRLIRQVRTSLVALTPPERGIRATLYSNGISHVTTGRDGVFTDIVVRHDPAVVALTSPVNASGVFELDLQSDMLLPFESSGVDTTWELQLPRAANPFDYSSIVDVLVTIEYTALSSDSYRSQVVDRLNANRQRGADCVFSLARDFPDQWYDLNNPADPGQRSVTLTLRDVDFPLGVDGLSTADVAVRLSSGQVVPGTAVSLRHGTQGGNATATNGIASTRRGNAAGWLPLVGTDPTGDWQLGFGDDAAALFAGGALDDILFVVSWTGQGPAWLP